MGEDTDYTANSLGGSDHPERAATLTSSPSTSTATRRPSRTRPSSSTSSTSPARPSATDRVRAPSSTTTSRSPRFTTSRGTAPRRPSPVRPSRPRGIVTLLKTGQNTGAASTANGFFLQDPTADADPNTSEGIFVFTSSVPTYTAGGAVAVGDELTVTGTAIEFNGLTEIGTVTNIAVIDTGNPLPTAVTLTATILDPTAAPTQPQLEKYEGMRVCSASGAHVTVAPNDNFFDVYTVLINVARPMREPGIPVSDPVPPDPTSGTPDANIPIWDENPERLKLDTNGRAGAANVAYTSNVTLTGVIGPLDFAFGEYRLVVEATPSASANMSGRARADTERRRVHRRRLQHRELQQQRDAAREGVAHRPQRPALPGHHRHRRNLRPRRPSGARATRSTTTPSPQATRTRCTRPSSSSRTARARTATRTSASSSRPRASR